MVDLPLEGYRILDFCWLIAGPLTTRLLADLGADVIKVESLARMDRIREAGVQPLDHLSPNTNGVFHDCNTNKKSITINLGEPGGIEVIKDLVRCSDVVSANFTPERLDRWGLSYEELRAIRPDVVVANMPVMGKLGPRKEWGSYGNGIIAMAGLNGITGFPNRPPVGLGTLHSDFTTPYFGALQIMSALYERERTGEGQYLELAQYEAAVQLLDTELIAYLVNGAESVRRGNRSLEFAPQGVFPCAGEDRWIAISVRDTLAWHVLCGVMERSDLATRSDLQTLAGRQMAEDELEREISGWTITRDRWQITETLQALGVPASPVEDLSDLVALDTTMTGHFTTLSHPEGVEMMVQHQPVTWDGERLPLERAPSLGEHNEDVLQNLLGYTHERFVQLLTSNVIY